MKRTLPLILLLTACHLQRGHGGLRIVPARLRGGTWALDPLQAQIDSVQELIDGMLPSLPNVTRTRERDAPRDPAIRSSGQSSSCWCCCWS